MRSSTQLLQKSLGDDGIRIAAYDHILIADVSGRSRRHPHVQTSRRKGIFKERDFLLLVHVTLARPFERTDNMNRQAALSFLQAFHHHALHAPAPWHVLHRLADM